MFHLFPSAYGSGFFSLCRQVLFLLSLLGAKLSISLTTSLKWFSSLVKLSFVLYDWRHLCTPVLPGIVTLSLSHSLIEWVFLTAYLPRQGHLTTSTASTARCELIFKIHSNHTQIAFEQLHKGPTRALGPVKKSKNLCLLCVVCVWCKKVHSASICSPFFTVFRSLSILLPRSSDT